VLKYETAGGNSRNEDYQSNTQKRCYTSQLHISANVAYFTVFISL